MTLFCRVFILGLSVDTKYWSDPQRVQPQGDALPIIDKAAAR